LRIILLCCLGKRIPKGSEKSGRSNVITNRGKSAIPPKNEPLLRVEKEKGSDHFDRKGGVAAGSEEKRGDFD